MKDDEKGLIGMMPKHWCVVENSPNLFEVCIDENVYLDGKSALLISSDIAGHHDFLKLEQTFDGPGFVGKRLRFSCFVKTENVDTRATLNVKIVAPSGNPIVSDPMFDRFLKGSNDWTELFIVVDVPLDGRWISFGPSLWGKGKLWAAQFSIDEVSKNVSRTDDHGGTILIAPVPINLDFSQATYYEDDEFRIPGWGPPQHWGNQIKYSILQNARGDANAALIESTAFAVDNSDSGEFNESGHLMQLFSSKPFRGSRIKFSCHIKTEDVIGLVYPILMVRGVSPVNLALSTMRPNGLSGDNDWAEYSLVLDVSEFAYGIFIWLYLDGSGKAYFSSISVEVVSLDTPKTDNRNPPKNLNFSE